MRVTSSLRRETFGFELAQLPRSLQLSAAEAPLNRGPRAAGASELATSG